MRAVTKLELSGIMLEPMNIAANLIDCVVMTVVGQSVSAWLKSKEQERAFRKALEQAVDELTTAGFDTLSRGAVDHSFSAAEGVRRELWQKLLDPATPERINYKVLGRELENIYEDLTIGPGELEAVEYFVDVLIDKMRAYQELQGLLAMKIVFQHDHRLTGYKKKQLVASYLTDESEMVASILQDDLGSGKSYIEPLIEMERDQRKGRRDWLPTFNKARLTESYLEIDLDSYFLQGEFTNAAVIGESGSGKTTLLRDLLLRMAKTHDRINIIPILLSPGQASSCSEVHIRKIVEGRFDRSGYRTSQVVTFVNGLFRDGRFVFLIDALDQIPDLDPLLGCLERNGLGCNRVVITCRPNVFEMVRGHLVGYHRLYLREFDEARWKEYLGQPMLERVCNVVDKKFLEIPILLKLVSEHIGNRTEEIAPVKNRADLYGRIFNDLLRRPEEIAAIKAAGGRVSDGWYARHHLRKLAHDTLILGYFGQFPRTQAAAVLGEEKLKDLEAQRSVLTILEPGDLVAFRHRSFQEFLAAEYLLEYLKYSDADVVAIEPYFHSPQWLNTMSFLSGMLDTDAARRFILLLINVHPDSPLHVYGGHFALAARCIQQISEGKAELQKTVLERCRRALSEDCQCKIFFEILAELGGDEVQGYLEESLRLDPDPEVMSLSAVGLGKLGVVWAVPTLKKALKHYNEFVRASAAEALGLVKAQDSCESLVEALRDPSAAVRSSAIIALGSLNARDAIIRIFAALGDDDYQVQKSAARALREIQSLELVRALMGSMRTSDEDIREVAVRGLAAVGSPVALGTLVSALDDPSETVRATAADALGALDEQEAIPSLIKSLQDESAWVRTRAADALGDLRAVDAVPALTDQLRDPDELCRGAAVQALGCVGAHNTVALIMDVFENSTGWARGCAACALGYLDAREAVPMLRAAAQDTGEEVRFNVAFALGQIHTPESTLELVQLLRDPSIYVREMAAMSLDEADASALRPFLLEFLREPGGLGSDEVAAVLAQCVNRDELNMLMSLWRSGEPGYDRESLLMVITHADNYSRLVTPIDAVVC